MNWSVYLVTNNKNSLRYVGQTKDIIKRIDNHKKNKSSAIYADIKKYGLISFSIVVLETCETYLDALNREKFWIEKLSTISPNGYNRQEASQLSTQSILEVKYLLSTGRFSQSYIATLFDVDQSVISRVNSKIRYDYLNLKDFPLGLVDKYKNFRNRPIPDKRIRSKSGIPGQQKKLSNEQVIEIRSNPEISNTEFGRRFGVDRSTVRDARNRKHYKAVV